MAVEKNDDGDEEAHGEGIVGEGFVGFVEGVGFGELVLMVDELQLSHGIEDGEFVFFTLRGVAEFDVNVCFSS